MVDYDNSFTWIIKASNIFDVIEEANHIKINNENYSEIFENLMGYIEIEDVIYNTEKNPFLFNFVKGAIENPQKQFNTVFSEILLKEDLEKFGISSENFCEIKEKFHNGFEKFFKDSEEKLQTLLHEKFPDFNENLHFIDYKDLLIELEKTFDKFNENEENFLELKEKFSKRVEDFICEGCFNLPYKKDLLEILISAKTNQKNILFHDFDNYNFFNLNIDEKTSEFPKFLVINPADMMNPSFYPTLSATMIYIPQSCEKLISMFFEHSLQTMDQNGSIFTQIHSELRFEIFFEYLTNKGLKTNEEMLNFLNSKTYQEFYKEYDEYYKDFCNQKTFVERILRYIKSHFDFENYDLNKIINDYNSGSLDSIDLKNPMHFIDANQNIITTGVCANFEFKPSTWKISTKEIESMSQKNNIFDQIKNGLSCFNDLRCNQGQ